MPLHLPAARACRAAAHRLPLLLPLLAAPAALASEGATDPAPGAGDVPQLCLKVLGSHAPPGGMLQGAVALTEPGPILTSRFSVPITGAPLGVHIDVALFGATGSQSDVAGTAIVDGGELRVSATSPSGELGTAPGVPIAALGIPVAPDAPLGAVATLTVDSAASVWVDPSGQVYDQQQVKDGTLEVSAALSVTDVLPGIGVLPAGATVTVRGTGFQPGAIAELDGVPVAATALASDTELTVTTAADADMYGRKVKVRNPDRTLAVGWAYPRTTALPDSARPLLAAAQPVFSPRTLSSAAFPNAAAAGQFLAVALQNPGSAPADVAVELRSPAGVLATASLALPPATRVAREASELFGGIAPPGDAALVLTSTAPVQMLGLVGDEAAGTVEPLAAAVATP
jgi:hypothetical protein